MRPALRRFGAAVERDVVPRLRALGERPEMLAIQRALPVSFVGLVVGLAAFMLAGAGTLQQRFQTDFGAAFGVMSALLVVLLAAEYARRCALPVVLCTLVAGATFVVALPWRAARGGFFALATAVGSSGLFLAMLCAFLSVAAIGFGRRRLGAVPGTIAGSALVVGVAGGLALGGISISAVIDAAIAPVGNFGDSLTALLVIVLLETLLWLVGIHGPALLAPVVLPIYARTQIQNSVALAHHAPLPHIVTVSLFLFVFPGGCGATMPLGLLLLRTRAQRLRRLARVTLLPTLANSNEPLLLGLPIVLNPVLSIPFVVAPLVLSVVTYAAIALGLVDRPALYTPYAIPLPIAVFLATNDWRSIVLAAVDLAIATAIYAPFVRTYVRAEHERVGAAA